MLEKIIAFIFWLSDTFTQSRDPFLEEYRSYWRRIVVFSLLTSLGFICTMLMAPSDAPVTGLQLVIKSISELFYVGSLVFTLLTAIGFLWTAYRYWIFVDGNE